MKNETLLKLSAPVPRYTSYPTATNFHSGIGTGEYIKWLGLIDKHAKISLYLHIPFCDRLCWFCACHTKQVQRYDPVASYLSALHAEINTISQHLDGNGIVTAIHLGGGSPTLLKGQDLIALKSHIATAFKLAPGVGISIEIDPNDMSDDRYAGLQAVGITRASLGVQDFDAKVQSAINRPQGYDETFTVVQKMREIGTKSVNLDMLYGLPFQTAQSIASTTRQVLSMKPDRIALFGYAHVPWMKTHQTMIDESTLPGPQQRLQQAQIAAEIITKAGYLAVGIDHFALPTDSLALAAQSGRLRRNFQGYTDDRSDALIGLGASAIGQLPQGHVQNMPATGQYQRLVQNGGLATARGLEMSADDMLRGYAIERLMCDFALSRSDMTARFGKAAACLFAEANILVAQGELLERVGETYLVKPDMRPLARLVAARFDAYLAKGNGRHSAAV